MENVYIYNPAQYRSPQRVWDMEARQFTDYWRTVAPFDIWFPDGRHFHIPAGQLYDKASIPRAAWWWMPRDDKQVLIAALVHDFLYEYQQVEGQWITRAEADKVFYDLLRDAGMRYTKAQLAYRAVRLGGWVHFNKRAKEYRNPHYVTVKD